MANRLAPGPAPACREEQERGCLLAVRRSPVSKRFGGCRFAMKRSRARHHSESDLGWREAAVFDRSLKMPRLRA